MYQTALVYETATRLLYNTILCTIYMIPQILPLFEKTSQNEFLNCRLTTMELLRLNTINDT